MQIDKLDDQQRRHLHRSGVPQKDQKVMMKIIHLLLFVFIIFLENIAGVQSDRAIGAKGRVPRRQLVDHKLWKTHQGIQKIWIQLLEYEKKL
uniref:Uncharacterized protein n=1 Tax=Romanomermis culicivorax TaxID=13658 RepID=A0A915K8B1_ROMCU